MTREEAITMEYAAAIDKAIESPSKNRVKWLDAIETALVRAETARKDIDLVLVMRILRDILEEDVKHG